MNKEIIKTYITILGLVENILNILKTENGADRDTIKENIFAAVQATFTKKLFDNPQTSEVFKTAITNVPVDANFGLVLDSMQKSIEGKQINIDLLPILKESTKEVLNDFVSKTQKPEITELIKEIL